MTFLKDNAASISVTMRVIIALIGGFIIANLVALLISYLSTGNKVDGIVTGMMTSFIVYTLVVMFVFATKTPHRAFFGVVTCCAIVFGVISYIEMIGEL